MPICLIYTVRLLTTQNRVNMYASTWICTKNKELGRPAPERSISELSLSECVKGMDNARSKSVEQLKI